MLAKSASRRWPLAILTTFLCLSGSGCLVWDQQIIVSRFAPDGSEVSTLLIYEGLHVGSSQPEEQNFKRAKEELEGLMISNQRFYLLHPIFEPSLAPPKPGDQQSEGSKKGLALMQKHLTIAAGGFYLNQDNRLCAWQTVTVRDAQKFTEGVNELLCLSVSESIKETLSKPRQKDTLSDEMLQLLQKAAGNNHAWLKLEPGRLNVVLPGNASGFAEVKRLGLRSLITEELEKFASQPVGANNQPLTREALQKKVRDFESLIKFLSETPISIDQRADRMTFSLGEGDGKPLRLNAPFEPPPSGKQRKYEAELIEFARTLKVKEGVGSKHTSEGLIADFLNKNGPAR